MRVRATDDAFPIIEALLGQTNGPLGFDVTIDYVLEPDADYLRVITTVVNRGEESRRIGDHLIGYVMGNGLRMFAPGGGFDSLRAGFRIEYLGGVADGVSYTLFTPGKPVVPALQFEGFQLTNAGGFDADPEEPNTFESFLVIGGGDLAAHEVVHRQLAAAAGRETPATAEVSGVVTDRSGPVKGAAVHVVAGNGRDYLVQTITGEDGTFALQLPLGTYSLTASATPRLPGESRSVVVGEDGASGIELQVGEIGWLSLSATEAGEALPVKVQARRTEPLPPPPKSFGLPGRSAGYDLVEFLPPGTQNLPLPPGTYTVFVSRGFEYDFAERTVVIEGGRTSTVEVALRRVVDTPGWLSGDYHIHAQYSADSDDLEEHKVLSFAAENLEVPVLTEHEHIADFNPTIRRLGLERYTRAIVGEEVSTVTIGHFNAFPLQQNLAEANNGAIGWFGVKGDDLMKKMRANPARPLVQVNHPRSNTFKGYFTATGFNNSTFTPAKPFDWSLDYDALEIANGEPPRFDDWFAFLDRGLRLLATGNSDSHVARKEMVGYPRNYVLAGTDEPAELDLDRYMEALRSGKLVVSGGIFVEINAGAALPGSLVDRATLSGGRLPLRIRVQAPAWVPVGELEIVVNGSVVATRTPAAPGAEHPALRFEETVEVDTPAGADAYVLVHVRGAGDLAPVAPGARAFGFTNPIFVDANGNGRFDARIALP